MSTTAFEALAAKTGSRTTLPGWLREPLLHFLVLGGLLFAVDHVIPFALWGCNDLWNLMPVTAAANSQKSDKLPAGELLRARKGRVVGYWSLLRDGAPEAFDREAERLLGRRLAGPIAWADELFGRVREAVEVTALQRGVARWSPRGTTPLEGGPA